MPVIQMPGNNYDQILSFFYFFTIKEMVPFPPVTPNFSIDSSGGGILMSVIMEHFSFISVSGETLCPLMK